MSGRSAGGRTRFVVIDDRRIVDEPSVTSFLREVTVAGASRVSAGSSAHEGIAAHLAVALTLLGEPPSGSEASYGVAANNFLERIGAEPIGVEVPVYHPGRYGGYIDCVACTADDKLIAIDWKTGSIGPRAAVQLTAYIHASRALDVTGTEPFGHNNVLCGTSSPLNVAEFSACWVVGIAKTRWQAYGFSVDTLRETAHYAAYKAIFLDGSLRRRRFDVGQWWDRRLGPEPVTVAYRSHQ